MSMTQVITLLIIKLINLKVLKVMFLHWLKLTESYLELQSLLLITFWQPKNCSECKPVLDKDYLVTKTITAYLLFLAQSILNPSNFTANHSLHQSPPLLKWSSKWFLSLKTFSSNGFHKLELSFNQLTPLLTNVSNLSLILWKTSKVLLMD